MNNKFLISFFLLIISRFFGQNQFQDVIDFMSGYTKVKKVSTWQYFYINSDNKLKATPDSILLDISYYDTLSRLTTYKFYCDESEECSGNITTNVNFDYQNNKVITTSIKTEKIPFGCYAKCLGPIKIKSIYKNGYFLVKRIYKHKQKGLILEKTTYYYYYNKNEALIEVQVFSRRKKQYSYKFLYEYYP